MLKSSPFPTQLWLCLITFGPPQMQSKISITSHIPCPSYHYWKVSGLDLDNVELSGQFFYDGRSGGNTGYLDMDLVTVQEESLVLLHRIDAYDDWEEYDAYEKNILGSSDNGFGLITMEVIKPGEYTLANLDHAALSIEQPITALEIEV